MSTLTIALCSRIYIFFDCKILISNILWNFNFIFQQFTWLGLSTTSITWYMNAPLSQEPSQAQASSAQAGAYTCTRAYTPPPPAGPRTQPAEVQPHEIFLTAQQIFFTATKYTNIFPIIISVLKCIFTTTLAADILFRRIAFCLHCEILFTI